MLHELDLKAFILRALRFICLAVFAAGHPAVLSAGHQLDRTELRRAIANGSAVPFGDLQPDVEARMRGDIVDVSLYDVGALYYRVLVRRGDGRMVSAIIDARTGGFMPVSSEAARTVQETARAESGGGLLGIFQRPPARPPANAVGIVPSRPTGGVASGWEIGGGSPSGPSGNSGGGGGNSGNSGGGGNGGNSGGSGGGGGNSGGSGGGGGNADSPGGGGGNSGGSGGGGGNGGSAGGGSGNSGNAGGGNGGSAGGGNASDRAGGASNAGGGASDNAGRGRN